jgi:hypothetical protein
MLAQQLSNGMLSAGKYAAYDEWGLVTEREIYAPWPVASALS